MVYNLYVEFEFDRAKSLRNKLKHGIDFVEAQEIWNNDIYEEPAISEGEPRWLVLGHIQGVHWTAIITRREARIRIISVRRSRDEEKERYWQEIQKNYHG